MNTIIYEPITDSANTLGYESLVTENRITGAMAGLATKWVNYVNASINNSIDFLTSAEEDTENTADGPGKVSVLNSILINRNGPYQHPSWKQYRGGDHPVARSLRLNNTMSVDLYQPDARKREETKRAERTRLEHANLLGKDFYYNQFKIGPFPPGVRVSPSASLKSYYEPSVVVKYKPITYDVDSGFNNNNSTVTIRSTLMNQMVYFENHDLNEALKIASTYPLTGTQKLENFKTPNQEYFQLLDVATDASVNGRNFLYSQMMFPRSINVFRPYKLERPNYEEVPGIGSNGFDRTINRTFWRAGA